MFWPGMNQDQQVKAVLAPAPARGHHVRERGEVQQAVSLARTFVVSDGVEAGVFPLVVYPGLGVEDCEEEEEGGGGGEWHDDLCLSLVVADVSWQHCYRFRVRPGLSISPELTQASSHQSPVWPVTLTSVECAGKTTTTPHTLAQDRHPGTRGGDRHTGNERMVLELTGPCHPPHRSPWLHQALTN